MKQLIVNADDFGLCASVNAGIIEAFRNGIVKSCSLMANTAGFGEAVRLAKKNPKLDIGFHLNLVSGAPLSERKEVQSLLGTDGNFTAHYIVLLRGITGLLSKTELELEIFRQYEKIENAGIEVSHIDSHQHTHIFPRVFRPVMKLAREKGIKKIRFQNETIFPLSEILNENNIKRLIIQAMASARKKKLESEGMRFTDCFFGIMQINRRNYEAVLSNMLDSLLDGTSELMCHPGFLSSELARIDSYPETREFELEALKSPGIKNKIKEKKIELISFREL